MPREYVYRDLKQDDWLTILPFLRDGTIDPKKANEYARDPLFVQVKVDMGESPTFYTLEVVGPDFKARLVSSNPTIPPLDFDIELLIRRQFTHTGDDGKPHLYDVTIHGRMNQCGSSIPPAGLHKYA